MMQSSRRRWAWACQHLPLALLLALLLSPHAVPRASASSDAALRPKIFMYDLGEKYHNWTEYGNQILAPGCFYSLDYIFPQLLEHSPYWTNNTNEADFFYVNVWMYWPWAHIEEVVGKLQAFGPYWDRKQGRDHIFVVTADPGRCQFPQAIGRNAIYLHHFGSLQRLNSEPCNLFDTWGAECDPTMTAALGHIQGNMKWGCHLPHQDIVVPPSPYETTYPSPYTDDAESQTLKNLSRTIKLYYSGKIDLHKDDPDALPWSDAHYSFGSRQTLYRMFNSSEGFRLNSHHTHGTYWQDLSSSVFCVAAAGWAWGGRMKAAVTRGCIPVIIQDGIKVEWEEQLPLEDYAVRIPTWLAHKTPDILDWYIKSGRVPRMQRVLDCAWRLHWWKRPYGRAFELVMCELKRRALGAAPGRVHVDWEKCELSCGDGKPVPLRGAQYNNV